MVKITYTNIIVDEFSIARSNPFNKYVHFLSHIHSGTYFYHQDHLKGLSNSWDYGTIYCSAITKELILLKFPRLKCLVFYFSSFRNSLSSISSIRSLSHHNSRSLWHYLTRIIVQEALWFFSKDIWETSSIQETCDSIGKYCHSMDICIHT